jgi:hypothetical protein
MRVNKRNAFLSLYLIATLLATISIVVYFLVSPKLSQIVLSYSDLSKKVEFPYKEDTDVNIKKFSAALHVSHNNYNSGKFHIIPDDCLEQLRVNEKIVNLSGKNLCNYSSGFKIDLSSYLKEGDNEVILHVKDGGGKRGLDVRAITPIEAEQFLGVSIGFWIFLTGFLIMQKMHFPPSISILFGIGMALRIAYLIDTPWSVRGYDVDGHIDYIVYIATHGYVPDAIACWTCYHPPLYYLFAGGIYKLGLLFSKPIAFILLQLFSLVLTSGFLIFVLLIFKMMLRDRATLVMISALAIFFPSLIIHSVRIGNDVMLYFTYAGAFYFYLKWLKTDKGILFSTLFAIASIFIKANGLIIMAVLGISYVIRTLQLGQFREKLRTIALIAGVYIVGISLAVGLHVMRGEATLVSNSNSLNSRLHVQNNAINYLYFDPKIMIQEAYIDPWKDGKGRQYFWNYFWKSSLFGEFHYANAFRGAASWMSAIYIGLLLSAFFGMMLLRRRDMLRWWPFIINTFLLTAAAMYLRVSIPYSCSNDFRYSLPVLLSLFLFMGNFLEFLRRNEYSFLQWGIYALITIFSLLSMMFILFFL